MTSNRSSHPENQPDVAPSSRSNHADALDRLQRAIGYRFQDPARLALALTHSSVAYELQQEHAPKDDNEQLEFLGDAVLGLAVTEHLFRAYPEFSEGVLTRLRSQFVSRQHLWQVAQEINLGDCLSLGRGEEKSGGRRKAAILANAVEALIAAIYLDGGLEPAVGMVVQCLLGDRPALLAAAVRSGEDVGDHKSALQEYFQAHGLGQPRYQVTAETGPDHRKGFVVAVTLAAREGQHQILASAAGTRKKQAEQEAARLALASLKQPAPLSVSQSEASTVGSGEGAAT